MESALEWVTVCMLKEFKEFEEFDSESIEDFVGYVNVSLGGFLRYTG